MILPTKHLSQDRSLIAIAARVHALLTRRMTVSELWDALQAESRTEQRITFDWFVLSLDLLYAMGSLSIDEGVLRKTA